MTREARIDRLVRDLYTLMPLVMRDAVRGNRLDQRTVHDFIVKSWRANRA
jgi:hypothetical protein